MRNCLSLFFLNRCQLIFIFCLCFSNVFSQGTNILYLSGVDKDHTVDWEFYCSGGRNSGHWTTIPVPSCWEQEGFGSYNYGNGKSPNSTEVGTYRYSFDGEKLWKGKKIFIVFEGAMTDTKVLLNGSQVGEVHQGGFYQFQYDVTKFIKSSGKNLLEVEVKKQSENVSINKAERSGDFWVFGGIYRPVYLKVVPKQYIDRIAINAQGDGNLCLDTYLKGVKSSDNIKVDILDFQRKNIIASFHQNIGKFQKDKKLSIKGFVKDIKPWSTEFPNLYLMNVSLFDDDGSLIHKISQRFGFRTIELREGDGFYLNGEKIKFKGTDRHSFWPSSGRTTSKKISILDVNLMKDMNMNAVRMSHYPPDTHFLDVCDSLGLVVLDELTGWQNNYDDTTGHKLVKELVTRDVNHPSIVAWDNGNEGGFNFNLDDDFDLYDPQSREVIHPWQKFRNTNTFHYPSYNYLMNVHLYGNTVYFPTEFLHGLYDGGAGAGLDEFWNLMKITPISAGGFIWAFLDEAIERTDLNDSLDTHGNNAPDGIVGPYREKEGSFYSIKQIWAPIQIQDFKINKRFNKKILIENQYLFTNLAQCKIKWELKTFAISNKGYTDIKDSISDYLKKDSLSLKPGEKKWLYLNLPPNWSNYDALYITVIDPHNRELFKWSWPIKTAHIKAQELITSSEVEQNSKRINIVESSFELIISKGNLKFFFNKNTGYLERVEKNGVLFPFGNGPKLAGVNLTLDTIYYERGANSNIILKTKFKNDLGDWLDGVWTFNDKESTLFEYSYHQLQESPFLGITFDYPEKEIVGMDWLGRGPYHVWKNRLKGQEFGLWHLNYNNTVPGHSWTYPAFKGNRKDVYWSKINTNQGSFQVIMEKDGTFLQMLKMNNQKNGGGTIVSYPEGNIGFLNAIQPIGFKFNKADKGGVQGDLNIPLEQRSSISYRGALWFYF